MHKDCYNSRFWKLFLVTGNPLYYDLAKVEMYTGEKITLSQKQEEQDLTL